MTKFLPVTSVLPLLGENHKLRPNYEAQLPESTEKRTNMQLWKEVSPWKKSTAQGEFHICFQLPALKLGVVTTMGGN